MPSFVRQDYTLESSLGPSIGHVHSMSRQEEMPPALVLDPGHDVDPLLVIPDTSAHITRMKHAAHAGMFTRGDLPCGTMGEAKIALSPGELAVSTLTRRIGAQDRPLPQPARFRLHDALKEPVSNGTGTRLADAGIATKSGLAVVEGEEGTPTELTNSGRGTLLRHQDDSLVSGPGCWRTPGSLAIEILPYGWDVFYGAVLALQGLAAPPAPPEQSKDELIAGYELALRTLRDQTIPGLRAQVDELDRIVRQFIGDKPAA